MKFDLENYILDKINLEEWEINKKIPTENELIKISGLSKMSIRKIIEKLKEREILYTIQGRGVFVSQFYSYSKIRKLKNELGANKVICLPSSSVIPKVLLEKLNKNFKIDLNNMISFVKLYFIKDEIIAYTLNWLNNENKKYSLKQIVNNEGSIFNNSDFTKLINIHKLEKTSSSDKNILLIDFQYIPTSYSYYLKKDGNIVMIRITKTKPKYYKSFEVKNK